jgi:hypothetical protein
VNLLKFKARRIEFMAQGRKGKAVNWQLANCPLVGEPVAEFKSGFEPTLQAIANEPPPPPGEIQLPPEVVAVQQEKATGLENANGVLQKFRPVGPTANHPEGTVKAEGEIDAIAPHAMQLQQVGLQYQKLL